MRVLLDAHVSSRHVGRALEHVGHDVLALDQDQELSRLPDEDVLALAADEERIVITHNVRHYAPLARTWAEQGRRHAGVILVTLPHAAYGSLLRRLVQAFDERPDQHEWVDRMAFLGRG